MLLWKIYLLIQTSDNVIIVYNKKKEKYFYILFIIATFNKLFYKTLSESKIGMGFLFIDH